jgi:hypothetical protein
MFYADALSTAVATAIDWDLPLALLPLIITNQMASLSGLESERLGCTAWE